MAEVGWVYMVHPASGGTSHVPDQPGVVVAHQARGWELADEPVEPDEEEQPAPPAPVRKPSTKKAAEPAGNEE